MRDWQDIALLALTALLVVVLGARPVWAPRAGDGPLVEVVGAVARPGVHRLEAGQGVEHALVAAGASSQGATGPVEPGERLRVGADGAVSREPMHPFLVGRRVDPNRDDRQALLGLPGVGPARAIAIERARPLHAAADLGGVRGLGPRVAAEVAPLVDLRAAPPRLPPPPPPRVAVNTASAVELEALPGVGPVLAGRIVAEREARGPFRRVADLERVAGIGPATAARLAEHVELGP